MKFIKIPQDEKHKKVLYINEKDIINFTIELEEDDDLKLEILYYNFDIQKSTKCVTQSIIYNQEIVLFIIRQLNIPTVNLDKSPIKFTLEDTKYF